MADNTNVTMDDIFKDAQDAFDKYQRRQQLEDSQRRCSNYNSTTASSESDAPSNENHNAPATNSSRPTSPTLGKEEMANSILAMLLGHDNSAVASSNNTATSTLSEDFIPLHERRRREEVAKSIELKSAQLCKKRPRPLEWKEPTFQLPSNNKDSTSAIENATSGSSSSEYAAQSGKRRKVEETSPVIVPTYFNHYPPMNGTIYTTNRAALPPPLPAPTFNACDAGLYLGLW